MQKYAAKCREMFCYYIGITLIRIDCRKKLKNIKRKNCMQQLHGNPHFNYNKLITFFFIIEFFRIDKPFSDVLWLMVGHV